MTARDPRTWDKSAQMVRALPWNTPSPRGSTSPPRSTCGPRTSPTPASSSASSRMCSHLFSSRSSPRPSHNGNEMKRGKVSESTFQLFNHFKSKHTLLKSNQKQTSINSDLNVKTKQLISINVLTRMKVQFRKLKSKKKGSARPAPDVHHQDDLHPGHVPGDQHQGDEGHAGRR